MLAVGIEAVGIDTAKASQHGRGSQAQALGFREHCQDLPQAWQDVATDRAVRRDPAAVRRM